VGVDLHVVAGHGLDLMELRAASRTAIPVEDGHSPHFQYKLGDERTWLDARKL